MRALHTPWIYFGSSSTPQKENRQCRKERRWTDIVDGCPMTCRLVLAPSPLRTNGALKVDPGGVRRPACLRYFFCRLYDKRLGGGKRIIAGAARAFWPLTSFR